MSSNPAGYPPRRAVIGGAAVGLYLAFATGCAGTAAQPAPQRAAESVRDQSTGAPARPTAHHQHRVSAAERRELRAKRRELHDVRRAGGLAPYVRSQLATVDEAITIKWTRETRPGVVAVRATVDLGRAVAEEADSPYPLSSPGELARELCGYVASTASLKAVLVTTNLGATSEWYRGWRSCS